MQFHYHQREHNLTLKKSVQQKRFFFDKSTNHFQDLLRDKKIQFRNGYVIGRCWISDVTCFSEEIEDFAFHRRGCHVVLRNSLDMLKVTNEQQIPLKIRKHHSHRIQLNDENFINYQEGTLNGLANKLIIANSIFIEEMNSYIVENKIFPMGLVCEPPVNYQKVRCIKINDDTFCLQRINQQHCLSILIQRGKQIPFYNEVYCLEGQLSFVNGHFLFYHNGNLTLLNEHGIEYQEKIEGNCYLDGSEIFILQDVNILETHQNKCINFEIRVEGKILKIDIITTSLKAKMLLEENKVPLDAIPSYLMKTNDYKYIKHKLKKFWEQKVIQRELLLEIYQILTTLKKSNKVKGRFNLLRCYEEESLDKISLENCLKSKTLNVDVFIQLFQNHIIYNYVHFLNMLIKLNPDILQYFLPNNQLFQNYEPNEIGSLCRTNKLKDLAFLGTTQIPKIQANYKKIASTFLDKCYGQFTYSFQIEESDYFLYSLLISESQSRLTFAEFKKVPDKIFVLLSQSQQVDALFNKLNVFHKKNNLNWYDEMVNQLSKSANPVKIFQTILNDCPNLTTKQYLNSINLAFDRVMDFSIEHHKHFSELADLFSSIKNCFEDQDYEYLTKLIYQLKQGSYLSQIFCNFNVLFQLSFIINKIMVDVNECHKSLEQILDHYLINRIKSTSFQFQEKLYNFQNITDLRNCLVSGFKNFIKDEKRIEALIFKKNLDFGKYRESKQLCTIFTLSLNQFDDALAEAMFGYLSQQKKVDYIEDERKKFLEIINEIEKNKKQKVVKSRKAMCLYKFIILSKEIGDFRKLDQFKCNQILFSLYRRTQNLDYPYLTMKKKLAKANDLKVYDRDFCKFMLELAQKNFSINIQKAQLILDDLSKNGDEITQQESSIQLLQFSKDENQKQEAYWKVLKQSQSADSISILLNLYKSPQQQVLKPLNVQIISREIIDVPVDTTVNVAKFEIEYLKFYNENLLDVVFLDTLLKNPEEAFFLIKGKETSSIKELIKRMACNPIINSEKLLTYYLKNLVSELNIINLLQGQDKELQDLTQALVLSQHKKIFSDKKALFDKSLRQDMMIERLEQLELDNIIPELAYFQDLNIKSLKTQIFYQKIKKTNLRDYYLNQEQKQIQSYVKNQIKCNPELVQANLDLRYHFIIYEQIYGFTPKEKCLIRAFINQCILSPFETVKHYDRIYKQIIRKEFDFNQIKDDFQEILESENTFIIFEIVKYYYKAHSGEVTKMYCQKLLSDQNNVDLVKFWLSQGSDDKMKHALVQTMKEQSQNDRLNNYFKALQV